jgi:4-aminobutyrate aminotransferase/(S)-3-amino-2-methylpropionate transaminase
MVAMELVKNGDPHQPDADLTKALTKLAAEKGLVLLSCGLYGNVVRFLVPLTASDAVIREGLAIVADSLRELAGATARTAVNA